MPKRVPRRSPPISYLRAGARHNNERRNYRGRTSYTVGSGPVPFIRSRCYGRTVRGAITSARLPGGRVNCPHRGTAEPAGGGRLESCHHRPRDGRAADRGEEGVSARIVEPTPAWRKGAERQGWAGGVGRRGRELHPHREGGLEPRPDRRAGRGGTGRRGRCRRARTALLACWLYLGEVPNLPKRSAGQPLSANDSCSQSS